MCEICVKAQDATATTEQGPAADAWARAESAIKAWRAANQNLEFDDVIEECMAWAEHMDLTTVDRQIN